MTSSRSFRSFVFIIALLLLTVATTPAMAESDNTPAQYGLGQYPTPELTEPDKSLETSHLKRAMEGVGTEKPSERVGVIPEATNPPTRPDWMLVRTNQEYLSWCVNPGPATTDVAANQKCADGIEYLAKHYRSIIEWNEAVSPAVEATPLQQIKLPLRMLDSLPPEPTGN